MQRVTGECCFHKEFKNPIMSFRLGYLDTSIILGTGRRGEELGEMGENRKTELQGRHEKREMKKIEDKRPFWWRDESIAGIIL